MPAPRRRLSHPFLLVSLVALTAAVVLPQAFAQAALQFVPMTPCRVVDTRNPPGPFGGPALAGGAQRDFALPQGSCNIPGTAAAYSLNVTVVPQGKLSYLTVWPTGQDRPVISTLNSVDGRVKANAAIVPAGNSGGVSVYATNPTELVLDIDGYFVPATSSTLAFFPLTPCRVADTRWTPGPLGGPQLIGTEERDFPVLSSSCNIPSNALAYSLNFTAVPPGKLGYLTVWPAGQPQPVASTLNDTTGTIVANAALVPAGRSGEISVYPSANTDLVIDVDGYFAPSNAHSNPLSLYTLPPCRVVDTRNTIHAFSGTVPFGVLPSSCQVPGAQAYVLNATVIPQNGGRLGYLSLWPDTENQPVVSTLNALDGVVASNMAVVPTVNGWVDAYASNSTDLVLDIFSYFAPVGALKIMTAQLPAGTLNNNYSATLLASGGAAPYTWSLAAGQLPPGLNLNSGSGVIAGRPTTQGNYNFIVEVKDSESTPVSTSTPLSLTINASVTHLNIETSTLAAGTQNQPYNAVLAASGGLTPYTWSIAAGTLPVGLVLNSNTGAVTGTPSGGGTSSFTVQVSDSNTPQATATAALSIVITPAVPLHFFTNSLPGGNVGAAYSAVVMAVGGVYPYTWTISAGNLPSGLTLNALTGAVSGIPLAQGTSRFSLQVSDAETPPVEVSAQFSITINAGIVIITTSSLPNGIVGNAYSATLNATGGLPPYGWSILSGSLPTGLALNSSSGVISGTPSVAGTANFTVRVVDSEQPPSSATQALSITITPPPWTYTVLHNFAGPEGANPAAGLVVATDGNLYGTASTGGANGTNDGTAFRITIGGTLTPLYNFCQLRYCGDGSQPQQIIQGRDGNFYGVTVSGGNGETGGVIFKLTPSGGESALAKFCNPNYGCGSGQQVGSNPISLMQASDGNFYGVTSNAGYNATGGLWQLVANSWAFHSLYIFGNTFGVNSRVTLVQGTDGELYGVAPYGGVGLPDCANNCGTVFRLTLSGNPTLLYSFCSQTNCADGAEPGAALVRGSDGNFYGTTNAGGANNAGVIFRISPSGTYTVLHNFATGEGYGVVAPLLQASDGNFYGVAYDGGASRNGAIFKVTPDGTYTLLYSFSGSDGANPYGALVEDGVMTFYGTTYAGGSNNLGTVFRLQLQ